MVRQKKYLDKSGGGLEEQAAECHEPPSGKLEVKAQVEDSHGKQLGESSKSIGKRRRKN
jgi:hypothetical protein